MHFARIVEINDPLNPLLTPLLRAQIWNGLLRRVERPMEFLPQLKGCLIMIRGESTMVRELDFGAFTVRDRVRLEPMQTIAIDTESAKNVPAGKLVIAIEALGVEQLQLRFTYDVAREQSADVEMEEQYDRYIQSAYLQADIDSVKLIRALVNRGIL